jgi:lipopolysaccharide heptosyltransferase II
MKVLLSAYTGLGNFILRIPMIEAIRELYPDAIVDVITGVTKEHDVSEVLRNMTSVRKIHRISQKSSFLEQYRFFRNLKKENYDVFFLPFDSRQRFLIFGSYIAQIPLRVLHGVFTLQTLKQKIKAVAQYLLYPKTMHVPILQGRHEIDINFDLLEAWVNRPMKRSYKMRMPYVEDETVLPRFDLEKGRYIVLQMSARYGLATPKTWDPKNFRVLIEEIERQFPNFKIVTVGSPSDYDNAIKNIIKYFPRVVNTAGLTDVNDVVNILSEAKLVVTHDSGIMHVANALGIDLIALYGPTDHTRTRPLGKKSRIIYSQNEFLGSMYNLAKREDELAANTNEFECMSAIKVADVLREIHSIIDDSNLNKDHRNSLEEKNVSSFNVS